LNRSAAPERGNPSPDTRAGALHLPGENYKEIQDITIFGLKNQACKEFNPQNEVFSYCENLTIRKKYLSVP
jgi:hypothetical protein